MAYQIYLPPCYGLPDGGTNGRSYPTLYLLPGNIHDEHIWAELGLGQAADEAIRQQAIPSFTHCYARRRLAGQQYIRWPRLLREPDSQRPDSPH
jgi:hypothetical protein